MREIQTQIEFAEERIRKLNRFLRKQHLNEIPDIIIALQQAYDIGTTMSHIEHIPDDTRVDLLPSVKVGKDVKVHLLNVQRMRTYVQTLKEHVSRFFLIRN